MANQEHGAEAVSLQGGSNISLNQLVAATSESVLRVIREQERQSPIKINPKIWVGIWIDLDRFGPGGPLGGPGGGPGPAGGGGIG